MNRINWIEKAFSKSEMGYHIKLGKWNGIFNFYNFEKWSGLLLGEYPIDIDLFDADTKKILILLSDMSDFS